MVQNTWAGWTLGGRYKLEEMLGQGGMSAVYRAVDPNLRRVVAVKLIHQHLSSAPEFVRRFEEEAAAVAQLRHPNIIQVYDFNHDQGIYYMVLEFVPGETLQSRLARLAAAGQRLPYEGAIRHTIQVCEAADYAHKKNMIHRDIKPANVIIDLQERAVLMDFGIAKILGGQQHTATGAVIGTALYMSPEQIRGERIDQRSDIYSIGVMLYEMVNGRPPFEADSTMTLMMKHLNDPVPDLRTLHPDMPDSLVAIIEKALAKTPEERFQSAEEMAGALRRIVNYLQPQSTAGMSDVIQFVGVPASRMSAVGGTPVPVGAASSIAASGQSRATNGVRPTSMAAAASASRASKQGARQQTWYLAGGIGAVILAGVLCLALGGAVLASRMLVPATRARAARSLSATQTALSIAQNALASPTPDLTTIPVIASTASPTAFVPTTSTATSAAAAVGTEATPAAPSSGISVLIVSVALDGDTYVVNYETVGFIENVNSKHIHFYFNNIPAEQAAVPGTGPYVMYGGPRPFMGVSVFDKPADATQICAVATNPDHTAIPNSGSCFDLPAPLNTPAITRPTPTPKPKKDNYKYP
jgi:hypothetical protein